MMGKIVNQVELSELLEVSTVTLWEWQGQGLPIQHQGPRGQENAYDVAAVVRWMIEREISRLRLRSPREEGIELDNELKRRALAEKDRLLVPADQIEPVWRGRVLSAAAFLTGQHSRLAGILEATPGVEAKRTVLREQFALFLTRLGVDGARMQNELEQLLGLLPAETAAAFLARIHGNAEVGHG